MSEQDFQTPNNAWRLDGQVALVTGTTSRLGNRFARVLAAADAPSASSSFQGRFESKSHYAEKQYSGLSRRAEGPTRQSTQSNARSAR